MASWLQATQEILSSSKSGHLSRDINQAYQTGKDAQTSKDASDAKQICCFPLRKMY